MSRPRNAIFPTAPIMEYVRRQADVDGVGLDDWCRARGFLARQLYQPAWSWPTLDRISVLMGHTPYSFFPDFDRIVEASLPEHGTRGRYEHPYYCRCSPCREAKRLSNLKVKVA